MKKVLCLFLSLLPILSYAQSSLTIFSEDGYKFYLELNGQRQNSVPQTNVRIDGLSQPYYTTKIIFEDPAKPEIKKNIPTTDPQTNAFADVTYKIKTTRDGELKMRYFSATPVQPNYVAPPDIYVMHYGQPAPPAGGTVTQTTVTTTTTESNNMGANVNVGMGGVNMNVNINDPNAGSTTVTQTTTTTSYSSGDAGGGYNEYNREADRRHHERERNTGGCGYAMDQASFSSAKATISKASFDDTKLSTAKTILSANCVNSDQVMQICSLFSFEQSKLDFAKFAYSRTTDRNNYFKVSNIFTFDASRTELNEYITNH